MVLRYSAGHEDGLSQWLNAPNQCNHAHMTCMALANKTARTAQSNGGLANDKESIHIDREAIGRNTSERMGSCEIERG